MSERDLMIARAALKAAAQTQHPWLRDEINALDPAAIVASLGPDERDAEIVNLRASEAQAIKALSETDANCRQRFAEYRAELAQANASHAELQEQLAAARRELRSWERYESNISDALNSGDGTYRP